jgi:YidC/Oxa1 family membrane protein insertase
MGMDRNTVIGFVLLAILLFLYLFISTKNSQDIQKQTQAIMTPLRACNLLKPLIPSLRLKDSSATISIPDSVKGFQRAALGAEKLDTVENDVMKIVFSNKGGQPRAVVLKKYLRLIRGQWYY